MKKTDNKTDESTSTSVAYAATRVDWERALDVALPEGFALDLAYSRDTSQVMGLRLVPTTSNPAPLRGLDMDEALKAAKHAMREASSRPATLAERLRSELPWDVVAQLDACLRENTRGGTLRAPRVERADEHARFLAVVSLVAEQAAAAGVDEVDGIAALFSVGRVKAARWLHTARGA